jgi:hypothetical protein
LLARIGLYPIQVDMSVLMQEGILVYPRMRSLSSQMWSFLRSIVSGKSSPVDAPRPSSPQDLDVAFIYKTYFNSQCPLCAQRIGQSHRLAIIGSGLSSGIPESGEFVQAVKRHDWAFIRKPYVLLSDDDRFQCFLLSCPSGFSVVVGVEIAGLYLFEYRTIYQERADAVLIEQINAAGKIEWLT